MIATLNSPGIAYRAKSITNRIRVCHIINNLHVGGAEMMLYKLLANLDSSRFDSTVISIIERGPIGQKIEQLGIPVFELDCRRNSTIRTAIQLSRLLREQSADVVQTWMYHGNLLGGLLSKALRPSTPIFWNIRHSTLDTSIDGRSTILAAKTGARLSRIIPTKIIVNSTAGLHTHVSVGYPSERMQVIPNGFDCALFHPSQAAKQELRCELGVSPDALLVGMVARYHPHKDHATFIRAAAEVCLSFPNVHFVLCGKGIVHENQELSALIHSLGIENRVHLLGPRSDTPRIQAGIDLAVLSSISEGFPNVLGEAMACETPCISTDVGDAKLLIQDTGWIAPKSNPSALASAIGLFLNSTQEQRSFLGASARKRIMDHFSMESIAGQFARIWHESLAIEDDPQNISTSEPLTIPAPFDGAADACMDSPLDTKNFPKAA